MPIEEKPREKALRYGVEHLSNRELLALLLRCGYKGVSALQLGEEILEKAGGLSNLSLMSVSQLKAIKGISNVKALTLKTCFELAKRASSENMFSTFCIQDPTSVVTYLNQKIGNQKQEHFIVLFLDTKNRLIKEETIFIGTLNASVVHAREIFKAAIAHCSARIMLAHNHPSSDCIPSEQDILVTDKLVEVGKLIGIEVMDHIIIGRNNYFSFAQHQLMK